MYLGTCTVCLGNVNNAVERKSIEALKIWCNVRIRLTSWTQKIPN